MKNGSVFSNLIFDDFSLEERIMDAEKAMQEEAELHFLKLQDKHERQAAKDKAARMHSVSGTYGRKSSEKPVRLAS